MTILRHRPFRSPATHSPPLDRKPQPHQRKGAATLRCSHRRSRGPRSWISHSPAVAGKAAMLSSQSAEERHHFCRFGGSAAR